MSLILYKRKKKFNFKRWLWFHFLVLVKPKRLFEFTWRARLHYGDIERNGEVLGGEVMIHESKRPNSCSPSLRP